MIQQNLLEQINKFLDSNESITIPFELDGTFKHFKNGKIEPSSSHIWVLGQTWEYKGNNYQWARVGDWRTGQSEVFKSYNSSNETKQSLNHAKKFIEEAQKVAVEAKEVRHKECTEKWKPIFDGLHVLSDLHGYLALKRATKNYRARVRGATLLVPIEHPKHGFVGCQQIFKNDEGKYNKFFTKGLRITGSYTRLTDFDPREETFVYLTEGFATGTSIFQATKKPVIVAYNCNNIIPVIASLRSLNKSLRIVIAADDDHEVLVPKNPGRYKALQACKQFSNVIAKFPKFENPAGLSDFNDLHCTESLEKVTEQLKFDNSDFVNINPLGHKAGRYYYVNTQTNEIFNLTPAQHTPTFLCSQAKRSYWGQKYAFKRDSENNPTKHPDWDTVIELMFQEQRDAGFFENEKVRGVGAWLDNGQVVFNSGNYLHIDNTRYPISEHPLQTDYVYEAKKDVNFSNTELSPEESTSILEVFENLNYKNPADFMYLIGTLILAQAPGIFDWRPHIWLTGSRGSGKSTVLGWINDLVFNNNNGIIESPTPAGLRQMNANNAVTTIMDEAEPNSKESRFRLKGIMELARISSSITESKIIRGTSTGAHESYLVNSLFIMGSIQPSIENGADVSRFTVIELLKGDPAKFPELLKIASTFSSLKMKLLSTVINNFEQIRENQTVIKTELLAYSNRIDARQADQLSFQLAGYWFLKYRKPVNPVVLDGLFVSNNLEQSEYIEDNQESDENECLTTILGVESSEKRTVAKCITGERNDELAALGIRVIKKLSDSEFDVFFTSKNRKLVSLLSDTEFRDYSKVLRRLPSVTKPNATQRVNKVTTRGFVIRLVLSDTEPQMELSTEDELIDVPF